MKLVSIFLLINSFCFAQIESPEIKVIQQRLDSIEQVKIKLNSKLEKAKLQWISDQFKEVGTPISGNTESVISHMTYCLSYNEDHEQANWVMHAIIPAIKNGNVSRTNDFRKDSLVTTGTSFEKDYFLKTKQSNGKYKYDGFGYDRGHLAPSADFRWSETALSESYFYSNMSPQLADFNRLKWAELENWMREYVTKYNTSLIVVTAPVLTDDLAKIDRGVNKVSIPNFFVKVALDLENKRGIGFILPHQKIELPLESFAVSIDSIEKILGYDLFSNLDDELENELEANTPYAEWLPGTQKDDVKAISMTRLPEGAINTNRVNGVMDDGKKHTVCGKVVSTKKHKKGHVFIDLDKKFPHQVFSLSIFEPNIKNFDYEPEIYLINKEVCFTSKISEYNKTPNMVLEHGKQIEILEETNLN